MSDIDDVLLEAEELEALRQRRALELAAQKHEADRERADGERRAQSEIVVLKAIIRHGVYWPSDR